MDMSAEISDISFKSEKATNNNDDNNNPRFTNSLCYLNAD